MKKNVPKIDKNNIQDIMTLTPTQEGMLFHYLKDSTGEQYYEQLTLQISGGINKELCERAWNWVVSGNEMLRTVFRWKEVKNPVQIILKNHELKVEFYDYSDRDLVEAEELVAKAKAEERKTGFSLLEVPFKVSLYQLAEERFQLVLSYHHILLDGWSNGVILQEFFAAYHRFEQGEKPERSAKGQFKEFIRYLKNQDKGSQKQYWEEYFADFSGTTEMTIKLRESQPSSEICQVKTLIPTEIKEQMDSFIKDHEVTPAALLYTAWGILLQRYNNSQDVLFGTIWSGRPSTIPGIEQMVGMFINTLPLRFNSSGDRTVLEMIQGVNQNLHQVEDYENTPLTDLNEYIGLGGRQELFDTMLSIENYPLDHSLLKEGSKIQVDSYSIREMTHYDLTVNIELFEEYSITMLFYKNRFTKKSIQRLAEHYSWILQAIMNHPDKKRAEIELLPPQEKDLLIADCRGPVISYTGPQTLKEVFEEQAVRVPERVAAIYKDTSLTYYELNQQANRLAHRLLEEGIQPDDLVGVIAERSLEMLIGIYAIIKVGAAYLPIDPNNPEERIQFIVKDSGASLVVSQNPYLDKVAKLCPVIDLDCPDTYSGADGNPLVEVGPENLAYVIYTSGSTGKPKGVMIEHRGIMNRINWMQRAYPLGEQDVILQKTTYTFDVSVWEIFWWSFTGASVCLLEPGGEKNTEIMVKEIGRSQVTTMHFVPSMLKVFLEYIEKPSHLKQIQSLRQVFASGEALGLKEVATFNRLVHAAHDTNLINLYGPTEAAVDVSYFNCSVAKDLDLIPIGKPIDNMSLYIMDQNLQIQPRGVSGELCIAGVGLARGYLHQPKLTAAKFVDNPQNSAERLYRTGDLARLLPDGNLEYLGRIDNQVKVRGFRIELGEIENLLMQYPDIKEAAALIKQDKNEDRYLVAFYVAKKKIAPESLKRFLKDKLPDYMVPSVLHPLERLPLSVNGKVDRKALAKVETRFQQTQHRLVMPGTEVEKAIATMWLELLDVDQVGIHDNFFDLGGNSLKLLRLNSMLAREFEQEIPVAVMFKYPTIRTLAQYVLHGEEQVEQRVEVVNQPSQSGQKNHQPGDHSVAIIGMAGRFPGANNIDQFWTNLKNGVESISFFTDEELLEAGVSLDQIQSPNYVKAKGVLEGTEYFDAGFFGYSPKEAALMDPQLRILHECAWTALEDAGYNPHNDPQPIGLFVGASSNFPWLKKLAVDDSLDQFGAMLLNEKDFFSTSLAYKLDLKGPSMNIQTACSTSLVSVDAACRAILNGQCTMALAGGIGITYPIKAGYFYHEGMIFSPDGHCRAFDQEAQGTLPGNGVGMVLLKRLEEALADGDSIYAVIKGSAVNNDGMRKVGYTAPSIDGQAEVIRKAQQMAGVTPETIGYIETHGTGTELGDLVEIEALQAAFGTNSKGSCKIGSVKTNLGHLDAASGITGLIKAALSLQHKQLPPSLHFKNAGERIDFTNSPFIVNTELSDWPKSDHPLRAGVSSFGIGGTNAHVILEEATPLVPTDLGRERKLLMLSAKTEQALLQMEDNLAQWLEQHPTANLADLAYTLHVGRKDFEYRKMLICERTGQLSALLTDSVSREYGITQMKSETTPVVFMFSGIGSQYLDMGRELYLQEPDFREVIDQCCDRLVPLMNLDLREIIYPDQATSEWEAQLKLPGINQPLIFVFEYALAKLLIKWGIEPDLMIGYSFGEFVAACLAGVFGLEELLELIVLRGRLVQELDGGAMLSVPLTQSELRPLLPASLALAIDNGPSCIVSGSYEEVAAFEVELKAKRCLSMWLDTSYAIHSPLMEPILDRFREKLHTMQLKKPLIPYISNVSGSWITAEQVTDPEYWVKHLSSTVRFAEGMEELVEQGEDYIFIEIGPNRDLSTLIRHHLPKQTDHLILNLIRHPQEEISDQYYLLNRLGQLWLYGKNIDWNGFYAHERRQRVHLPTYPFARERFTQTWVQEPGQIQKVVVSPQNTDQKAEIADWTYVPSWERSLLPPNDEPIELADETWLVFGNDTEFCLRLVAKLKEMVQEVIIVTTGTGDLWPSEQGYQMSLTEDNYQALFSALQQQKKLPDKILHLWGISVDHTELSLAKVEEGLDQGYYSLLGIAKAIGNICLEQQIKMYLLTNDMHEITGQETLAPEKRLLLGPCNVIPLEYPNIECQNIDITLPEPNSLEESNLIQQLVKELQTNSTSEIVAYRGRYRWQQIFKPYQLKPLSEEPAQIRSKGTYLITGGMGGMGLVLSKYLAENFQARLVLTGRSTFPDRLEWAEWLQTHSADDRISQKINQLQEIEALGGEVLVYSVDVSEGGQMYEMIEDVESKWGKINGVIHAAGVPDGSMIQLRTRQMSEEVFAAKVKGTLILDEIFYYEPLDFFILCSSISAILKTFGQVAYSSANLFLDSYASYKNAFSNTKVTSINWDTWKSVGMAADSMQKILAEPEGLQPGQGVFQDGIEPLEGVDVFKRITASGLTQVIVSTRDLAQMISKTNELGTTVSLEGVTGSGQRPAVSAPTRSGLISAYKAPTNDLEQSIVQTIQDYFGIQQVGIDDNFFELGATSLDIIRISAKLKERLDDEVSVMTMFKYPTIRTLVGYLTGNQETVIAEATPDRTKQIQKGRRNLLNRLQAKKGDKNV